MLVCHFIFIEVISSLACNLLTEVVSARDMAQMKRKEQPATDHREACWTGNKDPSHLLLLFHLRKQEEERKFFQEQESKEW